MGRSSPFRHCRARAKKRYGMTLRAPDYKAMCAIVAAGSCLKVPKASGDYYVEFYYQGWLFKGVWNGTRLLTLLPQSAEPPYRQDAA